MWGRLAQVSTYLAMTTFGTERDALQVIRAVQRAPRVRDRHDARRDAVRRQRPAPARLGARRRDRQLPARPRPLRRTGRWSVRSATSTSPRPASRPATSAWSTRRRPRTSCARCWRPTRPSCAGRPRPTTRSGSCCCTPTCRWRPVRATCPWSRRAVSLPPESARRELGCRPAGPRRALDRSVGRALGKCRPAPSAGRCRPATSTPGAPGGGAGMSHVDLGPLAAARPPRPARRAARPPGTATATTTCSTCARCSTGSTSSRRRRLRPTTVALAAWFHDAVYDGADDDEERSAQWAERALPPAYADEVARLVRMTVAPPSGRRRRGRVRPQRRRPRHPGRRPRALRRVRRRGARRLRPRRRRGLPGRAGCAVLHDLAAKPSLFHRPARASCGRRGRAPTSTARSRSWRGLARGLGQRSASWR